MDTEETLECLNAGPDCEGDVEYRMPLSGTGRSFPRCAEHWQQRLDQHEQTQRRYGGDVPPADFDPTYAGETW